MHGFYHQHYFGAHVWGLSPWKLASVRFGADGKGPKAVGIAEAYGRLQNIGIRAWDNLRRCSFFSRF